MHGRAKAFRKRGCVRMQRLGTGPEAGSPARCSRCGSGAHERMRAWRVLCKDEGLRSAYLSRGGPLRRTAAAGLQSTVRWGIGNTTRIVQHVCHDHVQRCDTVQHVATRCNTLQHCARLCGLCTGLYAASATRLCPESSPGSGGLRVRASAFVCVEESRRKGYR